MKLKTKYILYISVIHAVFLAVTLIIYSHNKVLFVFCEATLLLSLLFFIGFYNTIFRSFRLLNSGIELINDKDFSLKFLPLGEPELDRLIVVFNKMIDQLKMERAKTIEKNFFLEKLIEASPAAIVILGKNNNIQTANPASLTLLNIEDTINLPESVSDLPSPWNTELSKLNETDTRIIQLNGINQFKCYKSYFIDRGVKQSFFIIEGLTKELLKAERQSYEKVVRMMSHEVNNSVGAVNSIIDSTIHYMEIQNNTGNNDYIHVLNVARERNTNLNLFTNRFAEIVRIPPPIISKCDIKEVVNHVLILFQPVFDKKRIKIKTQYDSDQTLIPFDYQQLELVLINIIKNAVQAIQIDGAITLIFKTQPSSLIIENTGEPIPETVQKRLFESFFTTKKEGQGIGLTLIREILTNHGYDFSLETRCDGITEFRIVFD
jgi:two-component system, NtrC family, nitrogen regulation sensor histidine kinase NtrY